MKRPSGFVISLIAVVALGTAGRSQAQPTTDLPGHRPAADLSLVETHVLELDGEEVADAEIYFSEHEAFYLVLARELEAPVMVSPRGRSVQRVDSEKIGKRGAIGADLGENAATDFLGQYALQRGVYSFEVDGRPAKLKPRPPMLGRQTATAVKEHHKRYAHKSRAHQLKRSDLGSLPLRQGEILVRVYFGSWDAVCERVLAKVMKLEEEFRGPKKTLRFEYYGLPRRILEDPVAKADGIYGVPAAIVYRDGEEIGRLRALELDDPEENLLRLLTD